MSSNGNVTLVHLMISHVLTFDKLQKKIPKIINSPDYLIEEDYYGFHQQVLFNGKANVVFGLKTGKSSTRLEFKQKFAEIIDEFKKFKFPSNTLLDGKIVINDRKILQKLMFASVEDAKKMTENLDIVFMVNDLIHFNDEPIHKLPLFDRKQILYDIFEEQKQSDKIFVSKGYIENKKEIYNDIMEAEGTAGTVFKQNWPYVFGATYKVINDRKNFFLDVIILKIYEGTGRYANMTKTIDIGVYINSDLKRIGTLDIMPIPVRQEIFKNKNEYNQRTVKVRIYETNENMRINSAFLSFSKYLPEDCNYMIKDGFYVFIE